MGKSTGSKAETKGRAGSTWGLLRWIESLQKSDQMFYNMMMVEIWSIAQTMDELNPGFWADYMQNRQTVMQQQLEQRKRREREARARASARKSSIPRRPISPLHLLLENAEEPSNKMVAIFSQAFEQELATMQQAANLSSPMVVSLESLEPEAANSESTASPPADPLLPSATETASASQDLLQSPASVTTHATTSPLLPDTQAIYRHHVVELPHLLRVPVMKLLPITIEKQPLLGNGKRTVVVTLGCWLTRRFLVPTVLGDRELFVLQRLDAIELEPGKAVICQLGFRLQNIEQTVHVQLVKSLQAQSQLVAEWVVPSELEGSQLSTTEAGVRVINKGNQACHLKAGQAFCRLEFQAVLSSISQG
ncbi:MAG: hypothetical protein NZ772_13825 [Cyanobacteria bacterium]|nr:hypothetical protein [Cyanobacteriota bacterium]MDW8202477.1 hypothetical protein [Cyanobacteriota bacterium SKYGB_h_bin112]